MALQIENLMNAERANLAAIILFAQTATEDQRKPMMARVLDFAWGCFWKKSSSLFLLPATPKQLQRLLAIDRYKSCARTRRRRASAKLKQDG
jgi:hypothetical protein